MENERDELFRSGNSHQIWQKYCGFLDLSVEDFMRIQEKLLLEELELVSKSPLGVKIMNKKIPSSLAEFRKVVPFTRYEDYTVCFNEKREDMLAALPKYWARTSGRSGTPKWIPYMVDADRAMVDGAVAVLILVGANKKGVVKVRDGIKILFNLPPRPYLSGELANSLSKRFLWEGIPPLEKAEKMEFQEKIQEGFKIALKSRVDYIGSLSSILVKIGETFTEGTRSMKFSPSMLHPLLIYRMITAKMRSKIEKRPILPKDLWPTKNIVCGGMDSSIFREKVKYYWGSENPAEMYLSTEGGYVAIQGWNKKGMTFYPYSNFLEFIPEEEWLKNRSDNSYQPATVLINELEAGKRYELVITNFYGMPLLRYRLGDLVKITALEDKETGVRIPQMVFDSRSDDIIDIAQFARLDEKEIWWAIQNTDIKYEDWTVRKEYEADKPFLHLYIELKEDSGIEMVKKLIHEQLKTMDAGYNDLEKMLGLDPLKVTVVSAGTFKRYTEEQRKKGTIELSHLKPAHMSVSDVVIKEILRLSEEAKSG